MGMVMRRVSLSTKRERERESLKEAGMGRHREGMYCTLSLRQVR